ncbi:MAG: DsbA family protein [Solirubrobacterales bacterium]
MPSRLRALLVVACAALVFAALAPAAQADVVGGPETAARFDGIAQHGRALGSPQAPVTLTIFIELKCPFCRQFDRNVLPSVISRYVRSGKVRVVAEPLAFIPTDSKQAATMAIALGLQNKFWNFTDLFYANQLDESTDYITDEYLLGIAAAIPGADGPAALAARSGAKVQKSFAGSKRRMTKLGVNGTPTIFINRTGKRLQRVAVFYRGETLRALRNALRSK